MAACYLLGYLGRTAAVEWAAWAGHDNDLWASLIMPLAGMARLGSYVAMFFVIRQGIPALAALPPVRCVRSMCSPPSSCRFSRSTWPGRCSGRTGLAFEYSAVDYRAAEAMRSPEPTDWHPDALPVGTVTVVLIVAALVARFVFGRLKDRMPAWLLPVRVYLDALWVFLVLTFSASRGVTFLINPSAWLSERTDHRVARPHPGKRLLAFAPLESLWSAAMWALKTAFGGAAVLSIWLAAACIVMAQRRSRIGTPPSGAVGRP